MRLQRCSNCLRLRSMWGLLAAIRPTTKSGGALLYLGQRWPCAAACPAAHVLHPSSQAPAPVLLRRAHLPARACSQGSIHEGLAFLATQPGIGCWRACSLLSFSLFFTLFEVFALIVIIADGSSLTSYAYAHAHCYTSGEERSSKQTLTHPLPVAMCAADAGLTSTAESGSTAT